MESMADETLTYPTRTDAQAAVEERLMDNVIGSFGDCPTPD